MKYYFKGKTIMLPTSVKLTADQWTGNRIVNHPRAKQMNNLLDLRLADVTALILELDVTGRLQTMTVEMLKGVLLDCIGHASPTYSLNLFLPNFQEYMQSIRNAGTLSIWNNTLNRLTSFCHAYGYNLETLTFDQMTAEWLEEFDDFLAITAPRPNARAINHRNIRAVFNYAKKRKKLAIPYPFDDFKIQHSETRHLNLTIEQARLLKNYDLTEEHIAKCRDIFMLMIYLRGINAADLFNAKKDQIINGRLEYYRRKTGAFTSVKIEPEAQAIINKYAGNEYVLDIAEKYADTKNYLRRMDKYLKKVGPVQMGPRGKKTYLGMFDKISSNGARHTWASLTFELGYSIDTASDGLTHKSGHKTTNIYVNRYKMLNVDRANRHVIDYILNRANIAENAN